MKFTKSHVRISYSLSPGEPLITNDCQLHQKTLKILSAVNPRTCVHRVCNSPSTVKPLWITTCICYSYIHPQWSCYYKIPWKTRRGFDNPLSFLPCCSCHLNTPTVNSRIYRVSAHPPVVHVLHKSLRNTTRYSENPQQPIALEFLVCFHYD